MNKKSPDNRIAYIYTLSESDEDEVRYVGCTIHLTKRYHAHVYAERKTNKRKIEWIEIAICAGKGIVINVIDQCAMCDSYQTEKFWIHYYLKKGHRLTNITHTSRKSRGYT